MVAEKERVLLVDDNPIFCSTLAEYLRAADFEVITAPTGERGFLALRDFLRPVDWVCSRAALPGLVDGWIIANAFNDLHPDRPALILGAEPRVSSASRVFLPQPTPATALEALQALVQLCRSPMEATHAPDQQCAA